MELALLWIRNHFSASFVAWECLGLPTIHIRVRFFGSEVVWSLRLRIPWIRNLGGWFPRHVCRSAGNSLYWSRIQAVDLPAGLWIRNPCSAAFWAWKFLRLLTTHILWDFSDPKLCETCLNLIRPRRWIENLAKGSHAMFINRPGIPYIGPEHGHWNHDLDQPISRCFNLVRSSS